MTQFQSLLLSAGDDEQTAALLRQVEEAAPGQGDAALQALVDRARQTASPDDYNAIGLALHALGRTDQAVGLFQNLVEQFPDGDTYRMNLAALSGQLGQSALCRVQLRHVIEHGADERMRRLASDQLDGYEKFVGLDLDSIRLRDLQLRSLRGRVAGGRATASDFVNLGRLILKQSTLEGRLDLFDEAAQTLQKGAAAFPHDVAMLELLLFCHVRAGRDTDVDAVSLRLEKIDPHSSVLAQLRASRDVDAEAWSRKMAARCQHLLGVISNGTSDEKEAALTELQRISAGAPANVNYRVSYAFGLIIVGKRTEALAEAMALDTIERPEHAFHFNLGQVLWGTGDPARGRRHLNLAIEYATSDEERRDVHERIADLERPKQ
jgi:tetratricopeptide (TPR) repeat protein